MKMTIKTTCAKCGNVANYPEKRDNVWVCSICAASYDYAKAAKEKNYSLFN